MLHRGVSLRQLCAAAACSLLLPISTLLACGDWLWVGLGAALACLYYIMYGRRDGKPIQSPVWLGCLRGLALLVLAGLLSQQVGALFPETEGLPWVGLGVLALAAAAASKGFAVVLRCGAVLFVPLALVCLAVVLLAIPGAHPAWFTPRIRPLDGAVSLLLLLLPASLSCFAPLVTEHNARPCRWAAYLGLAATLTAAVTAACLSPELAEQPMSFYTLARSVSVFGVMLRLESCVSGALVASAFSGMGLLLCAARQVLPERLQSVSVWYLTGIAALISLVPAPVLTPIAIVSGIFCVLFSVLTQALVSREKPEKKSVFFEKNS